MAARTAPGVGLIVAATLIAELPELGQIDRRSVAALAGLAPVARDSGRRSGTRSIGGGRPVVRTILYLAALQASRRSPTFSRFRKRLQAAGKSVKAAIITTARKLLVTLNAMLVSGSDFRAVQADGLQLPTNPGRFIRLRRSGFGGPHTPSFIPFEYLTLVQ